MWSFKAFDPAGARPGEAASGLHVYSAQCIGVPSLAMLA